MHDLLIRIPSDTQAETFNEHMNKEAMKLRNMYMGLAVAFSYIFYDTGHFAFLYMSLLCLCLVIIFVSSQ
jgi:hypothetical protein